MLNNVNYDIDITKEPPADDTARQYYFIEKAKAYVRRTWSSADVLRYNLWLSDERERL